MITFTVIDNATPVFNRLLLQAKRPRALLAAAGRAVANRLRKHYRELNPKRANQLGGKRTNFWLQIMRSVQAPIVHDRSAVVSITHPVIAHKVKGGEIRAKRARLLTIPVSPEAYGRTASTFEHETGLKLFLLKMAGKALLASKDAAGRLTVQYLLKASVNQKPDPDALPAQKDLEQAAIAAASAVLARQLATT